jgi:uroporphyrinogen III methyltransferase/synthase
VIFMGMRALAAMMQRLIDHGRSPSTPALVVQWASLPAQRTVTGTIADIADKASGAGMGLPALTIVGDVVGLRTRLRWFDNRPLFGKRVLVTRPPHQAGSLAHLLLEQGAEPVVLPTIDIKRIDPNPELDQALRRLAAYDWIVFTSQNAVQEFFSALTAARLDTRALGRCQVAAIGTATSERLRAHGIAADLIPGLFQGEGVIDSLRERLGDNLRGVRFLIPRASVARVLIPQSIRALGGIVDVVALYHTVPTEPATQAAIVDALQSKTIDIVTFTSSSTVDQFMTAVGPALAESHACLDDVVFASIGPITTTRARELGLRVHVTASEFTTDGLVRALVQHYE